ncbi:hypothetical protein [Ectothiorhodospira marina]|uniref:Nucleotidyltransferase substrate binding protein, HI0074 family n=1 Tax=Ectothiorhodospira marina TaxID=1396821 RepID=A0A1H7R511_9GAMM|nr:hypothetical protein [Ectothiorhodospira marina]SEL55015.1 hypothetical protein SAMN05444515_12052 [Ectothiorhodospira marina]
MPHPPTSHERLRFLADLAQKEARHLALTDARLFAQPFTEARAQSLAQDIDLAERADAFVARFGRLQDTLGDKLIPRHLEALGEKTGAAIDNLDKAERLGWVPSTDQWLAMRKLRNQMIHEYIDDPNILANALQSGHEYVPTLVQVTDNILKDLEARGWRG